VGVFSDNATGFGHWREKILKDAMHQWKKSSGPDSTRSLSFETGVALVAAALMLLGALYWSAKAPMVEKRDFSVTYLGCLMVHLGMGSKVYDVAEQRKLKASILPNSEALIFEHPPFEALLLSPLADLPYRTAYLLWGFINIAIWLTLPILIRPYAPVPQDSLGYLGLWLLFAPLGVTLFQGQSSLVVLLLYTFTFISLKEGHDFRAGLALALALFKFQFAIPMALIFVLRRKWSFVRGFLTIAGILGGLSVVAVGWGGIRSYLYLLTAVVFHPDNSSFGSAAEMATIEGFVHAIVGKTLSRSLVFLIVSGFSGLLILLTAWLWNRPAHSQQERHEDVMFGVAIIVSLVTGFHMFTHDLSPLILALLLVLGHLSHSGLLRGVLRGCLVVLWTPPIYFALLAWHHIYILFPVLLVLTIGMMRLASLPTNTFSNHAGPERIREAVQV
jgi:hypothetical protein